MSDNPFDPRGDETTCEICGEPVDDASLCEECEMGDEHA